jgi:hypothetical protein
MWLIFNKVNVQQHFEQICYTEFHRNLAVNMGSTDNIHLRPRQISALIAPNFTNLTLLNKCLWVSSVLDFIQIGLKYVKCGKHVIYLLSKLCLSLYLFS